MKICPTCKTQITNDAIRCQPCEWNKILAETEKEPGKKNYRQNNAETYQKQRKGGDKVDNDAMKNSEMKTIIVNLRTKEELMEKADAIYDSMHKQKSRGCIESQEDLDAFALLMQRKREPFTAIVNGIKISYSAIGHQNAPEGFETPTDSIFSEFFAGILGINAREYDFEEIKIRRTETTDIDCE